jgi:hypothetical protein
MHLGEYALLMAILLLPTEYVKGLNGACRKSTPRQACSDGRRLLYETNQVKLGRDEMLLSSTDYDFGLGRYG